MLVKTFKMVTGFLKLCLMIAFIFMGGCASSSFDSKQMRGIQKGMSQNDLVALLGEPLSIEAFEGIVIYNYDYKRSFNSSREPYQFAFKNGKLGLWQIDPVRKKQYLRQEQLNYQGWNQFADSIYKYGPNTNTESNNTGNGQQLNCTYTDYGLGIINQNCN